MTDRITVMIKQPSDKSAHVSQMDNTLESFQTAVNGSIEIMPIGLGMAVICNNAGRLTQPFNTEVQGKRLYGTLVITGIDSAGNITSIC